jgi:FkbM family methyltransferase
MFKNLRLKIIKFLIDLNEKIFFERRLKKFYLNYQQINTVFDIGANKGQTIDFFLKINPNCFIFAFEPNPKLYQILKSKYNAKKNIKIFNIGISDTTGSKLFFENVLDYTSSFEHLNYDSEYLNKKAKILGFSKDNIIKDKYEVSTMTLADFFKINSNITTIDVLKIDTEGHELNCLIGLFYGKDLPKIKNIQLESHNDDMYLKSIHKESISDLLENNGFREKARIRHGFGDFDEIIYCLSQ